MQKQTYIIHTCTHTYIRIHHHSFNIYLLLFPFRPLEYHYFCSSAKLMCYVLLRSLPSLSAYPSLCSFPSHQSVYSTSSTTYSSLFLIIIFLSLIVFLFLFIFLFLSLFPILFLCLFLCLFLSLPFPFPFLCLFLKLLIVARFLSFPRRLGCPPLSLLSALHAAAFVGCG